jgi:hypothetical protein
VPPKHLSNIRKRKIKYEINAIKTTFYIFKILKVQILRKNCTAFSNKKISNDKDIECGF